MWRTGGVTLATVGLVVASLAGTRGLQQPPAREIGGGQPAFAAPPIEASMSAAQLSPALDSYLSALAREDRFSGVVFLARGQERVFEKAYGPANRAYGVPNTVATRFNIASIGKQFTLAALEQLVAAGKVKYEDTLGTLLPEYPNEQARKATVRQLVDHRGGISDFFGDDFDAAPKSGFRANADYYAFVAPRPLYFEPGAERRYCNGCYIVLGEIIAKAAGMPYERYVTERVLAPAGMTSTGWFATDSITERMATGYTRRGGGAPGGLRANVFLHGAAGSAAGGAYSTVDDLWAFFRARAASGEGIAVAGGAPGAAALVEMGGPWTAIVLSNLDPPAASVGTAIVRRLLGRE
jgi:CubicO group peptidase (beta-lactamase class C family)